MPARPDPGFGHRGRAIVGIVGKSQRSAARELLVQPDGRILVAGYVTNPGAHRSEHQRMALARLLPSGELDPTFGRGGWALPPVGIDSEASALALQHGEVVVGGIERRGRRATEILLRYRPNGRLDRGFGVAEVVRKADFGKPLPDFVIDRLGLLATPGRLVLVCGGASHPVSAYRADGHRIPAYGRGSSIVPDHPHKGHPRYGPVAALQGTRPVLACTAVVRHGHEGTESTARLQRLTNR